VDGVWGNGSWEVWITFIDKFTKILTRTNFFLAFECLSWMFMSQSRVSNKVTVSAEPYLNHVSNLQPWCWLYYWKQTKRLSFNIVWRGALFAAATFKGQITEWLLSLCFTNYRFKGQIRSIATEGLVLKSKVAKL